MLLNYLKIAFRNLLKKKVFSIINVVGLSVGTTASLLIFLYVQVETSYDKVFPDNDRTYRMVEDRIYPDRVAYFAAIPGGFSEVVREELPEVEMSTRLVGFPAFAQVIKVGDNVFSEHYIFSADSNFFEFFPYKLVKGDPKNVLNHTNTIVLTESTAKRYFGSEDPIGKTIDAGGRKIDVVGVMQDLPENTHMKFDALTPVLDVGFLREPNFYIAGTFTYLKLAAGTDPAQTEAKFPALVDKYAAGQIERDLGVSYKKYIADGNGYRYSLQPISDIHLHSQRVNEIQAGGSITAVRVLSFIAVLIIVIAGINFVNLATARSVERAREVGVRKVLGSRKQQLISQFLSESMLISVVSIVLAIVFLSAIMDPFNSVFNTRLEFNLITNPVVLIVILIVTAALGVVAGLYPAFYISALRPVQVLKGKFQSSSGGKILRNGLVVFQFCISIILISSTLVVFDQLSFLQNKSLGFGKEDLLVINHQSLDEDGRALLNEIRRIPGVVNVGASSSVPGGYYYALPFKVSGHEEIFTPKGFQAEENFAVAMNLKIVEGRFFDPAFDDSLSVVVNRKTVAAMDLKDPVGTVLMYNVNPTTPVPFTIVGVVEDFNYESLHSDISPLVIMSTEGQFNGNSVVVVKLESGNSTALSAIEAKFKEIVPNEPFVYTFMEGQLNTLYSSENQSGKLLMMFTAIAIVIACFGLFGLAAYTANQRTKEIGVRKVLGASVASVVALLSKDFFKLVAIAMIIGIPVAWFMMGEWLQSFAYRVQLQPTSFLLAGVIVMVFTAITISYQAISASIVNPTESLKEE